MRVAQIAPSVAPGRGGVADYARLVGSGLGRQGIDSLFLVVDRGEGGSGSRNELPVGELPEWTAEALARSLADTNVDTALLHFVGYAYGRRGLCGWLADGLARWKLGSRRRLVVVFHELWAFGPPWRSSFWTHPLQRRTAFRLAMLADAWVTSTELYAKRLRSLGAGDKPCQVLPVLSNVGEPAELPPFEHRASIAVVFGQAALRHQAYRHLHRFAPLLAAFGIERIVDIGLPIGEETDARYALPIEWRGFLTAEATSAVLRTARLGLLVYPLDFAAKSGVLAAYAAHGVVPVLDGRDGGSADGLLHGETLLRVGDAVPESGWAMPPDISHKVKAWYHGHDLARTVAVFQTALTGEAGPPMAAV